MAKRIRVTIELNGPELKCLSDFASKEAMCVSQAAKLLMLDNLEHYGYDLDAGLSPDATDADHRHAAAGGQIAVTGKKSKPIDWDR